MKKFFDIIRKRPASLLLALAVVFLASAVLLGPRLVEAAKWNSWTIQYMWHALGSGRPQRLPASPPAGYMQANIWLAQNAIANSDPQRALELVEPLVMQNDPFALHLQATAMEQQGDFTGALQTLIRAKDPILLIALGDKLAGLNDSEDALEAYESAYSIDPLMGTAPLADYLTYNRNDLVSADVILRTALSTYPSARQRLAWYRRLGDNLRKQNSFDNSIIVYQEGLLETPKDLVLHIGLGWVYYEQNGNLQKAMGEFQKAIDLDKARGDGYFAMAQVLTRASRFTEADNWYSLALDRDQQREWYIAWGNNARSAGNFDKAFSIYQKTTRLFPDYAATYFEMAWMYRLNKQPGDAMSSIENALSLMTYPNVAYYIRAGQIYEWAGEKAQAVDAFEKALVIDPQNSIAQKSLSQLASP
jgi:tetratricopeptide (TPR) repeat protein